MNPDELLTPTVQRVLARNPDDSFDTEYAIWTHYNPSNRAASWNDLQITVLQIQNDLSLGRYEKAFLVTSGSYSPDLIDNLADRNLKRDLKLQSFNDLLGGLINFDPYLRRIVHDYENYYEYADPASDRDPIISIMRRCNLFKFFVPLRARMVMNSRRKFDGELEAYILGWLQEDGRNHLTILGDFGTGKSSFALWLTYTLAKTIIKEKWHGHRIPVFISLRDHAGKIDVREIITNTLINNYDMRHADFKSFERLLEAGRLLIILDGFDETATLTDRASTLRILRGLNSLVRRNSKVILTCRSHYFRTDEETQSELNRSLTREETELFAEQKGKENFEVVQLRVFRRDQIELFLERHYDGDQEKARSTLSKMQATYNLTDLSRRPVMLEMILKVWPRLLEKSKEVEVTPALLYGEYVDAWIDKVAKGNEDLMDPSTKRAFCQDLTKWMYRENREMLPYTEIEKVVREYFKDRPPAVYAALDTEVRTCTFLNRDSVG
ncbi:MAG: NACHT domain-containing protein, partial [Pyrinomonadaceae bacterium]